MEIYLVGGAVRDKLLDVPVAERDWVVVGATIAQMEAAGYRQLDRTFPVFVHPQTGEEYALARREVKVALGHKGFQLYAGPDVTLEEDLRRRDLTINAMAEAEDGTLIDPFGGREDLDSGILRHVSPAFVEDPLRVLRVARFAARFGRWGFRVAHRTHALMKRMADSGELEALAAERVWQETKRALAEDQPVRYFEVLHRCGALTRFIPELEPVLGPSVSHHQRVERANAGPWAALEVAGKLSPDPAIRYAALMGQLVLASSANRERTRGVIRQVSRRLRVEVRYSDLALMVHDHYAFFEAAADSQAHMLLAGLEALDALRRELRFKRYIVACQAIAMAEGGDPGAVCQRLEAVWTAVQTVNAQVLVEKGLTGDELGNELRKLRLQAIDAAVGLGDGDS